MRSDNYTGLRCMLAARLRKPTGIMIFIFAIILQDILTFRNMSISSIGCYGAVFETSYPFLISACSVLPMLWSLHMRENSQLQSQVSGLGL